MESSTLDRLRAALAKLLAARGQSVAFGDNEALFSSGRLDSLAATELIVILESDFGLDLSDADFDVSALDSLTSIAGLIERLS